jgi:hypothetical protein
MIGEDERGNKTVGYKYSARENTFAKIDNDGWICAFLKLVLNPQFPRIKWE